MNVYEKVEEQFPNVYRYYVVSQEDIVSACSFCIDKERNGLITRFSEVFIHFAKPRDQAIPLFINTKATCRNNAERVSEGLEVLFSCDLLA